MSFFLSNFARNFVKGMKKGLIIGLCGALLSLSALRAERVMVIADPHVLAPELMPEGEALEAMMAKQRKMIDLSPAAFEALMDTAAAYQPDLLLIPGDLTKDGEAESHAWVKAQLQTLGIPTLLIPGNHDLSADVTDAAFDALYADYMGAIRDTESHSYVAEPFPGVTILAIDGVRGNAGTGELSENTLNWLLAQADEAVAKGNLVIGMCHWQLMDHFDQQSNIVSACQLKDAQTIAQQLAQHKVHVVLTGHMHVGDVSTAFYHPASGTELDSLVEVSTGSPITFPCPYRWLEIAADRQTISLQTDYLTALDTIEDLYTYSRAWMAEHTLSIIPSMSARAWSKVEALAPASIMNMLDGIPSTDEGRTELFMRHMGTDVANLYLLHSEGNEPTQPEKKAVVDSLQVHMAALLTEVLDSSSLSIYTRPVIETALMELSFQMVQPIIESITEDITTDTDPKYTNRTDDLEGTLRLHTPSEQGIFMIEETEDGQAYDVLGRPVHNAQRGQVIIYHNHKYIEQ